MPRHPSQFLKLHEANSAGAEPKLPGGFGFRFAFGRMAGSPNDVFPGFSTINHARVTGTFRGTGVAKQDLP
jgi:hypothetical protein